MRRPAFLPALGPAIAFAIYLWSFFLICSFSSSFLSLFIVQGFSDDFEDDDENDCNENEIGRSTVVDLTTVCPSRFHVQKPVLSANALMIKLPLGIRNHQVSVD
jgi:hypothetical protein